MASGDSSGAGGGTGGSVGAATGAGTGAGAGAGAGGAAGAAKPAAAPKLVWPGQKWWKLRDAPKSDGDRAVRMLFAGGAAGAVAKTSVAPLERVKLLCQIEGMQRAPGAPRTGVMRMFTNVFASSGIRGFWVGNWANVVRIIPNKGILFASNDLIKKAFLRPGEERLGPLRSVLAGSMAGALCVTCTFPLDFIRAQLMANQGGYTGITDVAVKTVKNHGVMGLYRGFFVSLAGILPYAGLNFAAFDMLKRFAPKDEEGHTSTVWKLACGGAAGCFSQTATYPLDTIRRRMQLQDANARLYANSMDCFRKVMKAEGLTGLYSGLTANLMRAAPNVAIQFAAYGQFKKLAGMEA